VAVLLPVAAQAADAARGQRVFQKCFACHTVEPTDADLQGPTLEGVIGRPAAAVPGFEYSPALVDKARGGLVWTEAALDAFLAAPFEVVPENRMQFFGLPDPAERADLIAYLKQHSR
jgi:cytochrome c